MKVLFIKRRTLILFMLIIFVSVAVVEVCLKSYTVQSTIAVPLSGKIILIDPGHGGIDAGASGNNAVEKEINLSIAKILQEYIEMGGGVAYLTRTDDSNTADPNRAKGVSQKMSDLKERKKDIDDFDANLFISIHMNKFRQEKYRGAQVFYDPNSQENKELGEIIQQSVKDVVKDQNNRKAKATGDSIFVLKGNKVPSALIECGFLSNSDEARLLNTSEYQRKIAWGIYVGIVRYFSR